MSDATVHPNSLTGEPSPPPPELIRACAAGQCVLFAGSGLSVQAGLPTWRDAIGMIFEQVQHQLDESEVAILRNALAAGQFQAVSDLLSTLLAPDQLRSIVGELYGNPIAPLPPLFTTLSEIPFASVITANWDQVMEQTFAARDSEVILPDRAEELPESFREGRFVILKTFGDPINPRSFTFTLDGYRQATYDNPALIRYLASVFSSRTVLFAGVSLAGIEDYLTGVLRTLTPATRHFALVPWQQETQIQIERFRQRWGIELLVYEANEGHPHVPAFFDQLRRQVTAASAGHARGGAPSTAFTLNRVVLSNIGPFEALDLSLGAGWNVLLGTNGSGKSTILRAIGLGLCGGDEKAPKVAQRLLRSGQTSGSIELTVGTSLFRTDLIRDGVEVLVRSNMLTPLQSGSWVVVGFPPLRGVSSRDPKGPTSRDGLPHPVVDDVLPLITGGVDQRVDDLKQWIVNTQLRSERAGQKGTSDDEAVRWGRLRDSFFDLLAALTPGLTLEFSHLDPSTWQVMVKTDDGVVPLDQISQGTSSILGWAGTLLQRMYEIYPNAEHAEREPALVMVDELDAHMHPLWQSKVVDLIKSQFPNLQVIATTHSPFIVGNLEADEMVSLCRDEETGRLFAESMQRSFKGWRVDQILTSPAFGLETTRSQDVTTRIERYHQLLSTPNRSDEDEELIHTMERGLTRAIPPPGETEQERVASQMLEQWMVEQLQAEPDAKKQAIISEANALLKQVSPRGDAS